MFTNNTHQSKKVSDREIIEQGIKKMKEQRTIISVDEKRRNNPYMAK